jgi:MFS family permease
MVAGADIRLLAQPSPDNSSESRQSDQPTRNADHSEAIEKLHLVEKRIVDASIGALSEDRSIERATIKRVTWRLLPLLMLGYFCSFLDRANIGMAAPTMLPDLHFSNAVFGFGAGVFFLGYFLAEIPSNLILNRLGARRWIARILITWGIISGLTAFVWNDWSFYGIRFLLGLAEAGFYPGVVLYLTWWFPASYRTRMVALFQSASVLSLIIGPPVGGLILQMNGLLGLAGWQWLYIIEALPSVLLCAVIWRLLTDRPHDATWLPPDQRGWLVERLESERTEREAVRKFSLGQAFTNPKVVLISIAYIGTNGVSYGVTFFLPLIVKGLGVSTGMIGVVSALPFLVALVGMNYWGWHSDKTGERKWHAAGACLLCAAGLAACTLIGVGHPVITMMALTCAIMAQQSVSGPFWAMPCALLTGTAAAGGIAMINAVGGLGGWFCPWLFGWIKDVTGSYDIALFCLALAPAMSAVALLLAGHDRRMEQIPGRGTTNAPAVTR